MPSTVVLQVAEVHRFNMKWPDVVIEVGGSCISPQSTNIYLSASNTNTLSHVYLSVS